MFETKLGIGKRLGTGVLVAALAVGLSACNSSTDTTAAQPASSMVTKFSLDGLGRLVWGGVTVSGFTATVVHVHEGGVGVNGPVAVELEQDLGDPNTWVLPEGARLSAEQVALYANGELYYNAHSAANPAGEVREQITPTTMDISGVTINTGTGEVTGSVTVSGFDATLVHIHSAFAGSDGGVVVNLAQDATYPEQFNVPANTILSGAEVTDYLSGKLYFNAHSDDFPSGQVREQWIPADVQVLGVAVEGEFEIPTPVTDGGSATGYVTVDTNTGDLNAVLNLHNVDDSSAAHIHSGAAGSNGGVVIGFDGLAGDTTWTISGAALSTGAGGDLEALLNGKLYINLHSDAHASGEARGQILPADVQLITVAVDGQFEVPTPVTDGGSGSGFVTVNTSTGALNAVLNLQDVDDATAAHIHAGVAGTNGGVVKAFAGAAGDTTWTIDDETLTTGDGGELEALLAGGLYINMHSTSHASGEARGQIVPEGVTVVRNEPDAAQAQTEGTNPSGVSAGTAIGYATVNSNVTPASIDANVRVTGITPTAAHVHTDNGGGVVLGLADAGAGDFWAASGTLDAAQLSEFATGLFYFNIHTDDNPGGELRGQIEP